MAVYSVNVYPSSTTIKVGSWYYDAYAIVDAGSNCNTDVTWYSNNTSVATVNASSGYIVTENVLVNSITLNYSEYTLNPNESVMLREMVCPTDVLSFIKCIINNNFALPSGIQTNPINSI